LASSRLQASLTISFRIVVMQTCSGMERCNHCAGATTVVLNANRNIGVIHRRLVSMAGRLIATIRSMVGGDEEAHGKNFLPKAYQIDTTEARIVEVDLG
jgi:hypothetical protein